MSSKNKPITGTIMIKRKHMQIIVFWFWNQTPIIAFNFVVILFDFSKPLLFSISQKLPANFGFFKTLYRR
jgi:hypothetical protein